MTWRLWDTWIPNERYNFVLCSFRFLLHPIWLERFSPTPKAHFLQRLYGLSKIRSLNLRASFNESVQHIVHKLCWNQKHLRSHSKLCHPLTMWLKQIAQPFINFSDLLSKIKITKVPYGLLWAVNEMCRNYMVAHNTRPIHRVLHCCN